MFNALTALGYGLVSFAILIGTGMVILYHFGGSIGCDGSATYGTFNASSGKCVNVTSATITPVGDAYTSTTYMSGQLGTSGLAGWTPAIIALSVGMLFLGAFLVNKGGQRQY